MSDTPRTDKMSGDEECMVRRVHRDELGRRVTTFTRIDLSIERENTRKLKERLELTQKALSDSVRQQIRDFPRLVNAESALAQTRKELRAEVKRRKKVEADNVALRAAAKRQ